MIPTNGHVIRAVDTAVRLFLTPAASVVQPCGATCIIYRNAR